MVGSFSTISMTSISSDFGDPSADVDVPSSRGSVRGRAVTGRLRTFATYKSLRFASSRCGGCGESVCRGVQAASSDLSMRKTRLARAIVRREPAEGSLCELLWPGWLPWFVLTPERDLP